MSYQVLARRWRPKSFNSLKGQGHVVQALVNAISRGRYHHAYLLTGTRGVGKTTLGRILAKVFNCETGVTATPCGQCGACKAIEAGSFIDLIEIDAASRTRVEDTRELLDNVQYAPTLGRFKIYLIDEVHMLSGHSFNALLKTLEEPPSHVIFILATTEPERIPITVLSRCLRLNLRPLSESEIVRQLQEILTEENIAFEIAALEKLARLAHGSMRDALSLLEQAIAFSEGSIQTVAVEDMLGISYQRAIPDLVNAIVRRDVEGCLRITQEMEAQGADFDQVCTSLQSAFYALSLSQTVKNEDTLRSLLEVDPMVFNLKQVVSAEEVQLLYQLMLIGKRDLPYAPDPKTGMDMLILRMIVFRPVECLTSQKASLPVPPRAVSVVPVAAKLPDKQPASVSPASRVDSLEWGTVVSQLPLTGLSGVLVRHCVVKAWNGTQLALVLEAAHQACLNPARHQQIQEALSQYWGRPIRLTITPGEVGEMTPSQQQVVATQARANHAVRSIEEDSVVKNILSTFDASVEQVTVLDESAH